VHYLLGLLFALTCLAAADEESDRKQDPKKRTHNCVGSHSDCGSSDDEADSKQPEAANNKQH
jgi:hypothetical protein